MLPEQTPKATERRLAVTEAQAAMIARLKARVDAEQRDLTLVASTILAGYSIPDAEILRLEAGPVLVVRVLTPQDPTQ